MDYMRLLEVIKWLTKPQSFKSTVDWRFAGFGYSYIHWLYESARTISDLRDLIFWLLWGQSTVKQPGSTRKAVTSMLESKRSNGDWPSISVIGGDSGLVTVTHVCNCLHSKWLTWTSTVIWLSLASFTQIFSWWQLDSLNQDSTQS